MTNGEESKVTKYLSRVERPGYRNYVLLILLLCYVSNIMDRGVLSILLEPIKHEFNASDTQLGLLGGLAFAFFYSTLGIPVASLADRFNRRNIIIVSILLWSCMTLFSGLATSFLWLVLARVGIGVGEAGGTPPSQSMISDYFPPNKRATALSIYGLGIPLGTMLGNLLGGWGNDFFGWRSTFALMAVPGIILAILLVTTVDEPPRGMSDKVNKEPRAASSQNLGESLRYLWNLLSFRYLCFAATLHALATYGSASFNAAFFIRSHHMTTSEAGSWWAMFSGIGVIGLVAGGYIADKVSSKTKDRRWYMWVPGIATLFLIPFQFIGYLSPDLRMVIPSFTIISILGITFIGPTFAMVQSLATLRMRALASAVYLLIFSLFGLGLGPTIIGMVSDFLAPWAGTSSLRYALLLSSLVNLLAAFYYFRSARTLRQDLETTDRLNKGEAPA